MRTAPTSFRSRTHRILPIFLCLSLILCAASVPASADNANTSSYSFLHLPIVEEDPDSSSGRKTTWSCVYFGSYPSSEIVDGSWEPVDDYALPEGDLIRDDALYERLEAADWQDRYVELDGITYLRAGLGSAPSEDSIREQHYRPDPSRPRHYFRIQPIRWRVLDIKENRALLLADRIPDSVPFHDADEETSWDVSTLRIWLNGYGADANKQDFDYTGYGFIDRAFTAAEREAIVPTLLKNPANIDYGTYSGEDTEDLLFILSTEEVYGGADAKRYGFHGRNYDDPAKRFTSTLYAKYMGAWWSPVDEYAGNSFWFMRTSGYTPRSVTYVCDFGYIYNRGTLVTCGDAGVLPAMWIDLDKAEIADAGEAVSAEIMYPSNHEDTADSVPEIENPESIPDDAADTDSPVQDIVNPVTVPDESMPGGMYTVWNAVAFGHYPQTEILEEKAAARCPEPDGYTEVNPELFHALDTAAEDSAEEVLLDDIRYVRSGGRWFRCDPIIWRVLEVSDGTALLMADRCLDSVPYHAEYLDVFWENSDLRGWLNGTLEGDVLSCGTKSFTETAFTEEEFRSIVDSHVSNAANYYFGTACGSETRDKVFLLSEEEVCFSEAASRYGFRPDDAVADPGRRIIPTAYASARGAWKSELEETPGVGFWFLRTNGYTQDNVIYVGEKGYLYNRGIPVTCSDAGIVPAIRIRLDAAPIERAEDISSRQEKGTDLEKDTCLKLP